VKAAHRALRFLSRPKLVAKQHRPHPAWPFR
jgi:hypothetical protein